MTKHIYFGIFGAAERKKSFSVCLLKKRNNANHNFRNVTAFYECLPQTQEFADMYLAPEKFSYKTKQACLFLNSLTFTLYIF